MTLYQKIISVVGMLKNSIELRATKKEIAPAFDPSRVYDVDRLVRYNGDLYRCTTRHEGAWNASHFAATTIDAALATKSNVQDLYVKDETSGLYHKVVIGTSGGVKVLSVDQDGVSMP